MMANPCRVMGPCRLAADGRHRPCWLQEAGIVDAVTGQLGRDRPTPQRGDRGIARAGPQRPAPAAGGPRGSLSVVANRQLRPWPSAVSLTRSQEPQNGLVTEPITPILAGPPLTRNASAGAEPRAAGSSGVSVNSADRAARISSAVTP